MNFFIALCQPVDSEHGHVGSSDPQRLELGPEGHNKEHTKSRCPGASNGQFGPEKKFIFTRRRACEKRHKPETFVSVYSGTSGLAGVALQPDI
jgi:hypothetical protein